MRKIRNIIKEKAGVSPIIAIILMVAITVVLAATIYVWVSGMGKSGQKAPNLSCNVDNIYDKVTITDVETGTKWNDIKVIIEINGISGADQTGGTGLNITLVRPGDKTYYLGEKYSDTTFTVDLADKLSGTAYVNSGDYFKVTAESGVSYDYVSITLVYKPTNTNLGTWTVYG